jgi:hypothetical protein
VTPGPIPTFLQASCSHCDASSEDTPIYLYVSDGQLFGTCVDCYHHNLDREEASP